MHWQPRCESPKYSLSFSSQFIFTTKVETALYYFLCHHGFHSAWKEKTTQRKKKRKANKRRKKENDRWEQILEGKVRRWLVSSRQTDPVFNLRECGVHFQTVRLKSVVLRSTLPSSELVKDGGIRTQQGKCKIICPLSSNKRATIRVYCLIHTFVVCHT